MRLTRNRSLALGLRIAGQVGLAWAPRMDFQLSDVLKAIGPNAAIIFAAWIFLSFLQARYDSAINRYRASIEAYRGGDQSPARSRSMKSQIEIYARRRMLMSSAVTVGLPPTHRGRSRVADGCWKRTPPAIAALSSPAEDRARWLRQMRSRPAGLPAC